YVHEGAHLHYVRQIHPDAKILPPQVIYHKNAFRGIVAAIDTRGIDKKCDLARLLTFVKGLVAGGVVEAGHEYLKSPEKNIEEIVANVGDDDDRKNYPIHCAEIRAASPGLVFDSQKVREDAILSVAKDLMNPDTKAKMDATIEEVKNSLLAAL